MNAVLQKQRDDIDYMCIDTVIYRMCHW